MESYSVINQTATPHSNLQNSTVAWSWWPEVNTDSDDDELIKIPQNRKKKSNEITIEIYKRLTSSDVNITSTKPKARSLWRRIGQSSLFVFHWI